jgi:hypothetical protein
VLLLRLMYLEHEVGDRLPADDFKVLLGHSPPELVSYLLQEEYFWAAEQVLEVCFRREEFNQNMIDLKSIWEAIERFCKDTDEERLIWARIAVLQTYCEGYLRRRYADNNLDSLILGSQYWTQGMSILCKLITTIHESMWIGSRVFIRQELLLLDTGILQQLKSPTPFPERRETVLKLVNLLTLARHNDDIRSRVGVQWRIEVLVNCKDPRAISTPHDFVAVPSDIYLLEALHLPQNTTDFVVTCSAAELDEESSIPESRYTNSESSGEIFTAARTRSTTVSIQQEGNSWNDSSVLQVIDTPGLCVSKRWDY